MTYSYKQLRDFTFGMLTKIGCPEEQAKTATEVLLSADYSQLELRILAHLCGDSKLCSILSATDGDVFRIIASGWKKKPQSEVTDDERQQAKQICYGIVCFLVLKQIPIHFDEYF